MKYFADISSKMALAFLKVLIIVNLVAFSTSEKTCKKKDVCSCTFKDGSTVNLHPVDNTKGGPRFTDIKGQLERTFDWNPCTPFDTKDGCKHTLVCQVMNPNANAGTDDTTFSVNSEGNVVIAYGGYKKEGYTRKSEITLKCNQSTPGDGIIPKFTETKLSETSSLYSATFNSKFACATAGVPGSSGGLSTGSILLIIFFPLVLMYVIIGVLINRYGRGIESMPELFPNHSFWADFPFLVKDGVVFTFGCIKSGCSSLSQKCGKNGYAEI